MSKIIKEFRYSFILYITQRRKGVVCQRNFDSKLGLKDDINEAANLAMDLIYSDIQYQIKDAKPTMKPHTGNLILSIFDNNIEVASVEQSLSNVKRSYININIKDIIPEIYKLIKK